MRKFAETADRIAATTKKLEKTALLAGYLKSIPPDEAPIAAIFFSGRPFPMWEETTLQVGGSLLWRLVQELSEKTEEELTAAYRKFGDLGAVAGAVLLDNNDPCSGGRPRPPSEVQQIFRQIAAARGPIAKGTLVRELLQQITPREAKYIIKIMTGDLRIGLKESLVEEAIAKAYGATPGEGKLDGKVKLKEVQRANMLLGDIGETLRLAADNRLGEAKMRLFHPIGFMLASPAESAEDALTYFQNAWVEDKYDGIRAQAHCSGDTVRFFSRTRDEITESFPELPDALAGLPQDAILDGEIVAWSYLVGDEVVRDPENVERQASSPIPRALPFSALQQRLGRKKVSDDLMRQVPVAYIVFDVLYAGGELLIDRPLRERAKLLDELLASQKRLHHRDTGTQRRRRISSADAQGRLGLIAERQTSEEQFVTPQIIRAGVFQASSPDELNQLFDAAQTRGNEGLMIKDPESPYTPGRRGKSWLKLKRELATLDVVVTAAEYGHGKRIGVLSDYTFAVRDGDRLLNIGKAYSGLTDVEIAEMTRWFLEHTIDDQGFRRLVEPKIVLEVAFNNIMKSDRH
ncbi:MAG: ligase ATP-dependent (dnl1), partial [Candidatus Acidoferrum typicum]|nr:ligase ATP-dependent (dnl1) [Candidatus Acidoferrum typicum]